MQDLQGKNIALFGPQGSGKGTQAQKISEYFGIPHLSTGNIFREAIANETELGKKVEDIINRGELVPDEMTDAIVKERLEQEDAQDGFILDGYPRNENQAHALDSIIPLHYAIVITISDEEAMKRITRRRVGIKSGRVYHLDYNPPQVEGKCDVTGEDLIHRDDDQPEAVAKRLEIYHSITQPILDIYRERGVLHEIDGDAPIEEVWNRVLAIFE